MRYALLTALLLLGGCLPMADFGGTYDLQLPAQYAVEGRPWKLYLDTIITADDSPDATTPKSVTDFTFDVTISPLLQGTATQTGHLFSYTPVASDSGVHTIIVKQYDGTTLEGQRTGTLYIANDRARVNPPTLRIALTGDSLTARGKYVDALATIAAQHTHAMKLVLVGTLGTTSGGNAHDGENGSSWLRYRNQWGGRPSSGAQDSPIVNGGYGVLDLPNYATNLGGLPPDVIVYMFGINLIFTASTLGNSQIFVNQEHTRANEIFTEWQSVYPNARHLFALTTPGSSDESVYEALYGVGHALADQYRWETYQRSEIAQQIIDFGGREVTDKIYLATPATGTDPINGYPVDDPIHIDDSGGVDVAESIYAAIRWHFGEAMATTALQHVTHNVGGTVAYDGTHARPATSTVSAYKGDGNAVFEDQTTVVSPISTTANGAITAGDKTVTLASAADVNPGDEFWIRTPDEKVQAKTISGAVVTLWRPVRHAHATGVTVEGTKLSYAVTAAQADSLWWDGRLVWKDASGLQIATQGFVCTKYGIARTVTAVDLADELPKLDVLLPANEDPERLLETSRQDVVRELASTTAGRAHTFVGPEEFNHATVLAAAHRIFRRRGSQTAREMATLYKDLMKEEIELRIAGHGSRDADQDGTVEEHEQRSLRSARSARG